MACCFFKLGQVPKSVLILENYWNRLEICRRLYALAVASKHWQVIFGKWRCFKSTNLSLNERL